MKRGVLLALAALLAAGALGAGAYRAGMNAERNAWLARDNAQLRSANARIAQLQAQARAQEQAHGTAMAAAAAQFKKDLHDVRTQKDGVIADLRSGRLRLRVPVVAAASAACGAGGASTEAGAGAAGGDGEARAELSGAAAEFLVSFASEADAVVRQLSACQAVVAADRELQGSGDGEQ